MSLLSSVLDWFRPVEQPTVVSSASAASRLNYAYELDRLGRTDEAAAVYWSLVENNPDEVLAGANLADIWIRQGKFADAVVLLQVILGRSPKFSQGWCNLSAAFTLLGDHQQALHAANQAVEADNRNHKAYYNRAECWLAMNQTRMAIRDLERSQELEPSDMEVREKLDLSRLAIQDVIRQPFGDVKHEMKAHGAWIVDGIEVAATLQCPHCDTHFVSMRGTGLRRYWCGSCGALTCGAIPCDTCRPFMKVLEDLAKA